MSRPLLRAFAAIVLGLLTGALYARRDQVRALFAGDGSEEPPPAAVNTPPADLPAALLPADAPPAVARVPRFGMNLAGIADWSTAWPFVNLVKASRAWEEHDRGPFAYDAHGHPKLRPGRSVSSYMCRETGGHYPAGRYVLTWKGKGRAVVNEFDVVGFGPIRPGRFEFDVKPADGGLLLRVLESDPNDPVRDLRVTHADFERAESVFHPLFVERLKPFGAIRFMGWQQTNDCPVRTWAERAKVEDVRWSSPAGAPVEVMADLANAVGADAWFCIPHQADDDYVRRFAETVRDRLRPQAKVYVEYSNEVWNWGFGQAHYAEAQGNRLGLGAPARLRFYAQRSLEIFRIFEEVFGGKDRLVRVLAVQAAGPWEGEQVLTWKDAYRHADAVAIAPYFGYQYGEPHNAAAAAALPVDRLLDGVGEDIEGAHRDWIKKYAALARKYQLQLMAYEGGQHLVGTGGAQNMQALTNKFVAANRHPRMYDLTRRHLDHWFAEGGGLYMAFLYVSAPMKWGSWGTLEYQDQPLSAAHKYRALLDAMKDTQSVK